MAGHDLTGVHNEGFSSTHQRGQALSTGHHHFEPWTSSLRKYLRANDLLYQLVLDRILPGMLTTEQGRLITPYIFEAFFLAIIGARKRSLDFAAENLGPQDPASHSLLAQACNNSLVAALFWDMTSVSVEFKSEGYEYEEIIAMALEQQEQQEQQWQQEQEEEDEEEEDG